MREEARTRRLVDRLLLREMNDRIRSVQAKAASDAAADIETEFLCECGDESCTATLSLTLGEFEALHWMPNCFAVAPGHEPPWSVQVVSETNGYVVVESREKTGL